MATDEPRNPPLLDALEPALRPLVEGLLAACDAVLTRVWLIGPGDVCADCARRSECLDQRRCLHLVASAGRTTRVDGPFRRIPMGARLVGEIPTTRAAVIARDDLGSLGVAEPSWLSVHGVHGFGAWPLLYGADCIGVAAAFSRGPLPERDVRAAEQVLRLGSMALGTVRAFRDIALDRNRLAARAARLGGGKALPADRGDVRLVATDLPPSPELTSAVAAAAARAQALLAAPPGAAPLTGAAGASAPGGGRIAPGALAAAGSLAPPPFAAAAPPAQAIANRATDPGEPLVAPGGADLHADRAPDAQPQPLPTFAEAQRRIIEHTLAHTGWRVSGPRGAAKILGLKPTTLESKMKKLGVRRPRK